MVYLYYLEGAVFEMLQNEKLCNNMKIICFAVKVGTL